VQQVNAVESVSNIDVVCTDKTGTPTTGRLTLKEVEPIADAVDTSAVLGAFAAGVTVPNLTSAPIAAALPASHQPWTVRDEMPFDEHDVGHVADLLGPARAARTRRGGPPPEWSAGDRILGLDQLENPAPSTDPATG
jgi:magnesium-transporting ATPase (P-type)